MSRMLRFITILDMALLVLLTTCSVPPRPLQLAANRAMPTAVVRFQASGVASSAPDVLPSVTSLPLAPTSLPGTAQRDPTSLSPSPELAQSIDHYMTDLVNAELFHGTILVASGDQVVISKGYGMADAEHGIANAPQTRFRLASVSKQFTAMGIMLLEAHGKLNVQDSICTYLANCPEAWRSITIHNLLTHTSGIQNYTDFLDYDATQAQPATPDQLVARFRDLPLSFTPGTVYSYDNSGYVLLGQIIERVSGQSYADFLREQIFEPLGMRDTGVDGNGAEPAHAVGYHSFAGKAPPLDPSTLFGCGNLSSTVEDMERWNRALTTTSGQLLPQPLRDQMFTPFLNDYGYGWKISHPNGHLRVAHSGLMEGFSSLNILYPNDHISVIVLSNLASADVIGIGNYLAGMVLGS